MQKSKNLRDTLINDRRKMLIIIVVQGILLMNCGKSLRSLPKRVGCV